ncbi:MAG TPA: hypothetical protein VFH03_07230 [Actinoplanes sp.]|nr:hypothetical protein [Actinoplanes sp.]
MTHAAANVDAAPEPAVSDKRNAAEVGEQRDATGQRNAGQKQDAGEASNAGAQRNAGEKRDEAPKPAEDMRLSGYQAEAAKLLAGMSPARRKRRTDKESTKKTKPSEG